MKQNLPLFLSFLVPLCAKAQDIRLDSIVVKDHYKLEVCYLPEGSKLTQYDNYNGKWKSQKSFFFDCNRDDEGTSYKCMDFQDLYGDITFKSMVEEERLNNGNFTTSTWRFDQNEGWIGEYLQKGYMFNDRNAENYESYSWADGKWTPSGKMLSKYDEFANNMTLLESYEVIDGEFVCAYRTTCTPNPYMIPYFWGRFGQEETMGETRYYSLDDNGNLVCTNISRHIHDDYGFEVQNYRYKYEYPTTYIIENGVEKCVTGDIISYFQPGWQSRHVFYYEGELINDINYNICGQPANDPDHTYSDGFVTGYVSGHPWSDTFSWVYTGLGTNSVTEEQKVKVVDEYTYDQYGNEVPTKWHYDYYPAAHWTLDDEGRLISFWADNAYHPFEFSFCAWEYNATFDEKGRCTYLKTDNTARSGIWYWTWDDNGICTSYKYYDFYSGTLEDEFTVDLQRDDQGRLLIYDMTRTCSDGTIQRRIENAYRGDEQIKHLVYEGGKLVSGYERRYNDAGKCIYYMGINNNVSLPSIYQSSFIYEYDEHGNVTKEEISDDWVTFTFKYEYDYSEPAPSSYRLAFFENYNYFAYGVEPDVAQHCVKSCEASIIQRNYEGEIENSESYNVEYHYSSASSIEETLANSGDTPVQFYSISGARLAEPQKGINIIKRGNSVRKVIVE